VSATGYELVQLKNGIWSVRSRAEGETFHPVIGPAAEAEALYVRQLRLPERMAAHAGEFVIWDVGLGAAANVLTLLRASSHLTFPLRVLSFDRTLEPLRFALAHPNRLEFIAGYSEAAAELAERRRIEFLNGSQPVRWEVIEGDFPAGLTSPASESWPKPQAILFDAFSPARNPAMWTLPLFGRMFALLDPSRPCALATYSRSTMLRVTLLLAGFHVGAGHATGEKEETTIAANTPELIAEPLGREWLKRVRRSTSAEPLTDPAYRQAPLSMESWERLQRHPQFRAGSTFCV
jgi:hypothetical protein